MSITNFFKKAISGLTEPTKTCNKCGLTKPISEFYKLVTSKDGHHSNCKKCKNAYSRYYFQKKRDDAKFKAQRSEESKRRYKRAKGEPIVKMCSHCKLDKPLNEFYKDKSRKDGHRIQCKKCDSKVALERYHRKGTKFEPKPSKEKVQTRCIGISDVMWEPLVQAVADGKYRSRAEVVRVALEELFNKEKVKK